MNMPLPPSPDTAPASPPLSGSASGPPEVLPPAPVRPTKPVWRTLASVLVLLGIAVATVIGKAAVGALVDDESTVAPATPFEGTPAAAFAEGEAGIVVPTATAIRGFTAEQVAAALTNVKKALVASRIDPAMLVGHDPAALIALIAPDGRKDVQSLFAEKDFMHVATQIAEGHPLTADAVRVSGEMTFAPRTDEDIRFIEVKTNYVWVYPFAGELKKPGDHLVTIHDEITWLFPADADVPPDYRGMYIDSTQSLTSNIDCDLARESLVALGQPRFVPGTNQEDENAPFDPNGTLDLPDTC